MDSTALERSALERKDRDELMTIAQALGGKPGSRAKKADIIDLILELTGVSTGGDGAEADDAKAGEVPDAAADQPAGKDEPAKGDDASAGDAGGDDAKATATRSRRSRSKAKAAEPAVAADEPPAEWELEAGGDDASANGQQPTDTAPKGGQPQGQQAAQDGGDQADDDDSPNRRRRRRGRNRDRGSDQAPEEYTGEPIEVEGLLDLRDEGYGFLRVDGLLPSRDDVYISVKQARQFGLRKGDHLRGASRPALRNEKNPALLRIDAVNGQDPEKARERRRFESLTPVFPNEKLVMERRDAGEDLTGRVIDLVAPIGKGQRGMIVSPPKAGKTTVMKQIARSIEVNNPEVHLIVLLVDERPEEVTDFRRWLKNDTSMVVASTFDRPVEEHVQVAELALERAKRLVEDGKDVAIILDGITRLTRAYNLSLPGSGRAMSGGLDAAALYPPKKFFGAARNLEEGGSLTILATALVETGSRMDEVIFEEFKGTGNMELKLDRRLAERRVFPAIDVDASSTRHEELLFQGLQLQNVWKIRRVLPTLGDEQTTGYEMLLKRMADYKTNKDFLAEIGKA